MTTTTYVQMALNHAVGVARAVLVELYMMAGAFFCKGKEGRWPTRRATATNEEREVNERSALVETQLTHQR